MIAEHGDWSALRVQLETARLGGTRDRELLVQALIPVWQLLLSHSRLLRERHCREDDVRAVLVKLIEKFTPAEQRALDSFVTWEKSNPDKDLGDWMRIVTANATRDYLRAQNVRTGGEQNSPSMKRLLNEFQLSGAGPEPGFRPPFTMKETARQMLEFAENRLDATQLQCLKLWLSGASFNEMGSELNCSVQQAHKSLRAAIGRLRRHFIED